MNAKIIASLAFTSMFSLSTLLSPAHAEEQEKALNFGIISTESQQNLKPQWTPFLQDMEKKLGVKVNAFFAPDYAGIIQGMRFNKVDIAWYGNLSAMEAVDRANGQVGNDSNLLIVFYVQRAFTDKQQIKRKAQSFD